MTFGRGMSESQDSVERDATHPTGNLAPISLGLGIAGLLLGLVPFYGFFFALPLSVVAVVLGLTARGRPSENRRQATGGLVTGGMGLLLVVGWTALFAWRQLGIGSFVSQTSVSVGATDVEAPATAGAAPVASPAVTPTEDPPVSVIPGEPGRDLVTGLSGKAQVRIGERAETPMTLTDCALADRAESGVIVRGDGPDGRLVVAQQDGFGSLVLDVEPRDETRRTFIGSVTGASSSSRGGGLLQQRRRFEMEGQLRDLHTDERVEVRITVTCS